MGSAQDTPYSGGPQSPASAHEHQQADADASTYSSANHQPQRPQLAPSSSSQGAPSHASSSPSTPQQYLQYKQFPLPDDHSPPSTGPAAEEHQMWQQQQQQQQQQGDAGVGSSSSPPPYSIPSTGSPAAMQQQLVLLESSSQGLPRYTGLPRIDYRMYAPAMFEPLPDASGIKSTAGYLLKDAKALSTLVRAQATVPPKPIIVIRGNRGRKVDFDMKCNLMSLLIPEEEDGRLDYLRCIGKGEPGLRGGGKPDVVPHIAEGGLEAWVETFMKDRGNNKCFVLERQVANLDVNWLEGQIRTLVASTGYKGNVTVAFPVLHGRVVVQSPDRVNKLFTTISTLFSGKHNYEVVKAVWPFATHRNGEPGRRCVVQSEEAWWREWKDSLKYAIITKRSGWVSNEDKLEAIMEGKGKGVGAVDWGPDYDGSY